MSTLQPCPACGADIESDSHYCDQCGAALMKCPQCGRFCKGKFCARCGVPTVAASEAAAPAAAQPAAPVQAPPAAAEARSLVCGAMGVTLPLESGAVIGRITGRYAAQLGTFKYVSGTHARLDRDSSGWSITDLGSRNGTAVNGVRCSPTLPFRKGDTIRLSNFYDFTVQ